jgi:protein arginine N-methyltransferase 3
LPDGITHVGIIISEWMGYALLYKERIGFWNDVYGFDMSTMADDLYDEAIVDIVGPETMVSEPQIIKDLHLGAITARQLDFSSSFNLVSTAERRTKVHSFILYFDTFFTVTGDPVPPDTAAHMLKNGDLALVEVWPVGGKSSLQRRRSSARKKDQITSFSTGPKSVPTHWKQTLFLLREPIIVEEGTIVSGTFRCRKSEINSRELQVEIHYSVRDSADALPNDVVVEMYTVR